MRPFLLLSLVACAPQWQNTPHDTRFQRVKEEPVPKPARRFAVSDWWEAGLESGVRPLGRALSPWTYVEEIGGSRRALDVNAFEEVPASSWFEPRLARGLDPSQLARGSGTFPPPAEGRFTIIAGKESGATPGFVVTDSAGVIWYVKFDPPGFPEMATGAEMIASRVMDAAGYWVPQTHLLDLDLERLDLDPGATTRDKYNRTVPLDVNRLTEFFALTNPSPDGRVRAVFSRRIEGEHLGPFDWRGMDATDANDRLPHERRRSLRGLWVLFAWMNNTDTKSSNTLDTFIPSDRDRGLVRHYLLDLGDSIGAAGDRAKYRHEGYEPYFDWGESGRRLLALGARYPYWLELPPIESRATGPFEAKVFDPERWSPQFPNPAFAAATPDDTFWAAALLARLSVEHVGAAVDAAEYTSSFVRERLVMLLLERRRKLLEHAFEGYVAVDGPAAEGFVVTLTDLRDIGDLSPAGPFRFAVLDDGEVIGSGESDAPRFDLTGYAPR
ncbi:MAG: hypothetical protein AAFX94_02385, partial [Myxococcota bacterium]